MSELQDMLRVQARLRRKKSANALGDLFDNANKEIESLSEQLAKANEREKRLEKILQRYESEQLQPLKLRVRELEEFKSALAYSEETGFIDLNKFAIEKKIELLSEMVSSASIYLFKHDKLDIRANHLDMLLKNFCNYHREQLRKDQE